jgi:hypothetical protein
MKLTDALKDKLDQTMAEMEETLCNRILSKSKKLKKEEESEEDNREDK